VRGDRVVVSVRVQPRSRCTEVVGVIPETGALKIRVKSPPVEGAANKELLRFLGRKVLKVAPSDLEIVQGRDGRHKLIAVAGLTLDEVRERLAI
jgi:uncharacterized protein (TIGR00251 family)